MAEAAARQQKAEMLARLYDGKLRLERRNGARRSTPPPTCRAKNNVKTTGEITVPATTTVATDWYLELRDRIRKGEHLHGRSFAEMFIAHANPLREVSDGQRRNYQERWNVLKPHFEGVKATDVDTSSCGAFARRARRTKARRARRCGRRRSRRTWISCAWCYGTHGGSKR
jgi:hypothetical protein